MKDINESRYRLNWKGMLFVTESLLYADSDTPWILLLPILVFLYLPALFFSYLKLSPEEIELFYWPRYRLTSSWENIDHLGEVTLLGKIPYDALILKSAQQTQGLSRQRGIRKKWIIPLDDFRGWPDGELYKQLREHLAWFPRVEKEDKSS
jgi:hypothetical protein